MTINNNQYQPQPGDIVFSRKAGPMSWFIRVINGFFPYSHACLMGETINGLGTVYTTGFGGKGKKTLGFLPASQFRQLDAVEYLSGKSFVICRWQHDGKPLAQDQQVAILKWCKAQLGQSYPMRKSALLFWYFIKGKGVSEISAQPQKQHCYELVAKAYRAAGIELNARAENRHPSGYDAKELYLSPGLVNVYLKP